MFTSIWEDVKRSYNYGSMTTRLVIINVSIFVLYHIVDIFIVSFTGFDFLKYISLSGDMFFNITHPWVFISSMFLHTGFFHLFFNMLIFYWMGRILEEDLIGRDKVLPIYLLCGLTGAFIFILTANFLYPAGGMAYGASGAVMGILIATAILAPDYEISLILIGRVKLKYIALVFLLLDLVAIRNGSNTGGHFAHLGGALMGWIFVSQLKKGNDWSIAINSFLGSIKRFWVNLFQPKQKGPRLAYKNPNRKFKGKHRSDEEILSEQEKLDTILDKIKVTGYESLNEEEKEFLFRASQQK